MLLTDGAKKAILASFAGGHIVNKHCSIYDIKIIKVLKTCLADRYS